MPAEIPTTDHAAKLRSIARFDADEPWCAEDVLAAADEIERLRKFIQEVADGHDAMISRLVRDTAKEVLDGR